MLFNVIMVFRMPLFYLGSYLDVVVGSGAVVVVSLMLIVTVSLFGP